MFQHLMRSSALQRLGLGNCFARGPFVSFVRFCKKPWGSQFEQKATKRPKDVPASHAPDFRIAEVEVGQLLRARPLRFLRSLL